VAAKGAKAMFAVDEPSGTRMTKGEEGEDTLNDEKDGIDLSSKSATRGCVPVYV
jgi:hypothetical protein